MGGGGSMGAANASLKNNRSLLNKREKFKRRLGYSYSGKPEYDFPKSRPHILRQIKARLIEERKQRTKIRFIVFITISIVLITLLSVIFP